MTYVDEQARLKLGDMIREARERMRPRMNQAELGRRVGTSRPTISLLENGGLLRPQVGMLRAVAAALDIPVARMYALMGITAPDAGPTELYWLASQLSPPNLELLVELGHGLLRVQHRQLEQVAR